MPGERAVEEGVVRVDQFEEAPVVAEDRGEIQLGLAPHRRAQGLAEPGEHILIRGRPAQPAEAEPLAGEVLDEGGRPRVVEHPDGLPAEVRPERPRAGLGEQFVVGHAPPEEVRQPGRRRERVGPPRVGLDEEEESRRGEHGRERELDATLVTLAPVEREPEGRDDRREFVGRDRAAKCPGGEPGDGALAVFDPRRVAGPGGVAEDRPVRRRELRRGVDDRAAHDHRIDVQPALAAIALVAADVRPGRRGLRGVRPVGLARGERDVCLRVARGDREPVPIDDRLVLNPDPDDRPPVDAEADDQPGRRDRLGDPGPDEAELDPISPRLQRVVELDRDVGRERVRLEADQLDRGEPLGVGDDDRPIHRRLGRVEISLDVDGRDVQRRADVVVAEADLVGREGVGEPEVEADQVADRPVIFATVEATGRVPRGGDRVARPVGEQVVLDPAYDRRAVGGGRLGGVVRGHRPALDRVADPEPGRAVLDRRGPVVAASRGRPPPRGRPSSGNRRRTGRGSARPAPGRHRARRPATSRRRRPSRSPRAAPTGVRGWSLASFRD